MEKSINLSKRMESNVAIKILRQIPDTCMLTKLRYGMGYLEFKAWRTQCNSFLGDLKTGRRDYHFESIIEKLCSTTLIRRDVRHLSWFSNQHPGFYDEELDDRDQWFNLDSGRNVTLFELNRSFEFKFKLITDPHPRMDEYVRAIYTEDRVVSTNNIMVFLQEEKVA